MDANWDNEPIIEIMIQPFINTRNLPLIVTIVLAALAFPSAQCADSSKETELRKALTFYATFDKSIDADFAKGDARLFTVVATTPDKKSEAGLHTREATRLAPGQGLKGNALQFTLREAPWVFFAAENNVSYRNKGWSGTVSVWLRLDPETDLDPGYCDPIQLTTRAWNDAAFFVDFDKEGDPRDFRLGAFADLQVWNPENKSIPEDQRPLLTVRNPPFDRDQWTHVAFTWDRFNTGTNEGIATLFLNGAKQGSVTGWNQAFTWKPTEESRLYLGLNYIGFMDELACFDRALNDAEVRELFTLKQQILPDR